MVLSLRHGAAYVFLIICMFDFVVMPIIYELNDKLDPVKAVELSLHFSDPASQNVGLTTLMNKRSWDPLTLKSGGMFFMAFGAILGIAAFSRGQEKFTNQSREYQESDDASK